MSKHVKNVKKKMPKESKYVKNRKNVKKSIIMSKVVKKIALELPERNCQKIC